MWLTFFLVSYATPAPISPAIATFPAASATIPATEEQSVEPTARPTPALAATLMAIGPSIEAAFDGQKCTLTGAKQVATGERVISFENDSDVNAYLFVGRNYPGKTLEQVLVDMGTPGSYVDVPQGVAILAWDHSVTVGKVSYLAYTFTIVAEYHIAVEVHGEKIGFYACGPFEVVAAP